THSPAGSTPSMPSSACPLRPPQSTLFPYTTLFRSADRPVHTTREQFDVGGGFGGLGRRLFRAACRAPPLTTQALQLSEGEVQVGDLTRRVHTGIRSPRDRASRSRGEAREHRREGVFEHPL